ncbi:hypothetical protein NliqN6_6549 [Naganishia liquefaciens]|uniref:ATP-dependent DNA ligase family profile domain-containing protein n=1 Tax=Naganishia liquefaciens TaxID=104408 RepID=A0A8H3YJG4_9TREE|nr:hypothetical protein NliqN6_6549 [Naganishia liquefaciens]
MHPLSFERFSTFVQALGQLHSNADPSEIFNKYINGFPDPLPRNTGAALFRLLFPYFTVRRRYHLKENSLAEGIAKAMTLSDVHLEALRKWDDDGKVGQRACLGDEVKHVAEQRNLCRGSTSGSRLSILDIDLLLDELACHSTYSNLGADRPENPRTRFQILRILYTTSGLSPLSLSCITQIILQDLRPITCPLPQGAYHPALACHISATTKPPPVLDVFRAMNLWDWEMRELYRACGDLDVVCRVVEALGGGAGRRPRGIRAVAEPVIGVQVEIPKCEKGRSIESALKMIAGKEGRNTRTIWAETKYDGERMQIHVWLQNGKPVIKIYSKSKRDSTEDRKDTHDIILGSLGLPLVSQKHIPAHHKLLSNRLQATPHQQGTITSVILEAEMLPYNELDREGGRGPGIEEFWHLTSLGARGGSHRDASRHFFLSYFDILHINGDTLLTESYEARRVRLESVVREIPGFCQLAERTRIDVAQGVRRAMAQLSAAFDRSNFRIEEGLVLKAAESRYNDPQLRWVKLKRDFIPGVGDCVDLAILAVGWDKDRARELRVGPSVVTTLYAGVLTNRAQIHQGKEEPHFEILFRISYGMSKDQLGDFNSALGRPPFLTRKYNSHDCQGLSYRFTLRAGMIAPTAMLTNPINCEVMGAGFQKIPLSEHYELRWPRVEKLHRPEERSWENALDADRYRATCLKALGYLESKPETRRSPEGGSIAGIFRTFSEGGIDVLDLSLGTFPSKKSTIKKESPSPAQHSPPPRTPLPRRSRSMIEGLYPRTSMSRAARLQQKPMFPLLHRINAVEAGSHSPPSERVLSSGPTARPRTPVWRVKRRKRPPRTTSGAYAVLTDTLRTNTSASPTTLRTPSADPLLSRKRKALDRPHIHVVKSIRQLVEAPNRKSTRLILVDGHDAEGVARVRAEVIRRQSERAERVPIRLVNASRLVSAANLSAATVDGFTVRML